MTETKEEYLVDKKYSHGGRRVAGPGKKIGRPDKGKDKRVPMSFKLPPLLANKLKEENKGDRTELLVKLLAEYYGVNLKDLDIG